MKIIKITDTEYLGQYKIKLSFNDKTEKIIDFFDLLNNSHYPNEKKYLEFQNFKQFRVDLGDLIWNDYDLCFQAKNLYQGILRK